MDHSLYDQVCASVARVTDRFRVYMLHHVSHVLSAHHTLHNWQESFPLVVQLLVQQHISTGECQRRGFFICRTIIGKHFYE